MPVKSNPLVSRFGPASPPPLKQRIIGASFGAPGTGKTHFWLTAPGPIVVQSLDKGHEGVALEEYNKKDIHVLEYDWQPTDELDQDETILIRDKFIEDFQYAIAHARTVIWDKETDVWSLFRYAEFGAPNDNPRNYDALNQRYRKYINMPKALDINFGLIQGMKTLWRVKTKSDGRSGLSKTDEQERSGFGELEGLVHVNIQHRRQDGQFHLDVGKSRGPGASDIQDKSFPGLTFSELAQLVFPETSEDDWS